MNQVPFLDELKRELLEHAPEPTERTLPVRRSGRRLTGAWLAAGVFVATLLLGGMTWLLTVSDPVPTADSSVLLERFNVGQVAYEFRTYPNQEGPEAPCVGLVFDLDTGARQATMACPTDEGEETEYAAVLEASAWTFVVGYGLQAGEEVDIAEAVRVLTTEEVNGRRFFLIQFAQPLNVESFEVPVVSPDGTRRSIPTVPDPLIDEEPGPVERGPELEWRQVDTPGQIDRVRNLWTTSTGEFAIWTGSEIWVSSDGESWQLVASDPPVAEGNGVQVASASDEGWLVAGTAEDGTPIVALTSDGTSWTTFALPVSSPANELLTSSTEVVAVSSGPEGSVAVGAVTTGVNEEAVIAQFAPDLTGVGSIRFQDDSVEILESDGTVRIAVPFSDIDDRLAAPGVILDTVVWQSPDGGSWDQVELIEGAGPGFLAADTDNYYLALVDRLSGSTRILTSPTGVAWMLLAELQDHIPASSIAPFGDDLIVAGQDLTLHRIPPEGGTEGISAGPALADGDFAALTASQVAAAEYGVVIAAYDHTRGAVPYVALWYSPDGQRWSRQATNEIFGSEGNLLVAVGADRVIVANDPQGEGGLTLEAPFQIWLGTLNN